MRVLVGCEYSGRVRQSFRDRGHDAWSCDLLPCEDASPYHIQGDVLDHLADGWDLGIFHPPCTYLAVSGNRWMVERPGRAVDREKALDFILRLWAAPIPKKCTENPKSVISSRRI